MNLPLIQIKSPKIRPIIWLISCLHGDEIGGFFIIREIFQKLKKRPLLNGSLLSFPLANINAAKKVSRIIPSTKEDLNRCFPGKKNGTKGQKLAYKIFQSIIKTKPDLVIDIHNDWFNSIPHILLEPFKNKKEEKIYKKIIKIIKQSNLPILLENKKDYSNKTLTKSLIKAKIPALTIEAGGVAPYYSLPQKKDIQVVFFTIWDILSYFKMVKPIKKIRNHLIPLEFKNKILNYSYQPKIKKEGIIEFLIKPGQLVKKKQIIAKIYNYNFNLIEIINSPQKALVLGHADNSIAKPGSKIISLAIKN